MTIVWQSHARLRLPVKRNCLIFPLPRRFQARRTERSPFVLPRLIECPHSDGQKGTKANNSKKKETPAYELGARDSIPILARHQLLIIARGRSSPGGWTLGFAGAITIWLDRIENKRREFVRNFSTNGRIVLHQRRLTLHQQSGSIRGIHLLTLSKFPRQSFINYSLNEKEKN